MIPIRLELKNFMSYGEDVPPLDFSSMQMICLSGENGHGKSALLDSITWSLWGESRAGKNKHDELIRIGADEMSVQFTFEMDGQTYRVLRKRSRRTSGNQWELQQAIPEGGWRSLTGNTAGETEKAIQKLLRMSYDTFLNSAYLRQGQADQFVRQAPGKRKEILADILDLSRYDQLEAKSKERMRAATADMTDLERDINLLDADLSHEPRYREALAELQARRDAVNVQRQELSVEFEELRERRNLLKSVQQMHETLQKQADHHAAEIAKLQKDIDTEVTTVGRWRTLSGRRDQICRDFAKLEKVQALLVTLDENVDKLHRGQVILAKAEKELLTARGEIERHLDRATRDYEQSVGRLRDLPQVSAERNELVPVVARAADLERDRALVQNEMTESRERLLHLQTDSGRLNGQVEEWEKRVHALDAQQGVCSVCNAPLPPDQVERTRAVYFAELEACTAQRKQVWGEAKRLKETLAASESRLKSLESELGKITKVQVRLGQVEQMLLQLEAVQAELPNLEKIKNDLQSTLDGGQFAPEVAAKIEQYQRALASLEPAEADQAAARAELLALNPQELQQEYHQLQHAEEALRLAEERLSRAEENVGAHRATRADLLQQLAEIQDVAKDIEALNARGTEIRVLESTLAAEDSGLSERIGSTQQAILKCEEQKVTRAEKEKLLAVAKKEREVYDQLVKAFGKKGMQAVIIENAVPEIQDEANRLLERLTDGDMMVHFDTLRTAKSKKDTIIETLEIQVSDSLGTRPLEMYSGGESFRASFALRIALSKLLARRAGAKLQTLIIDEGFGTQDGKGREKLVESLNAIRADFEKIIVITHIDELKDAFPTRIEVIKTPGGSQVTVLEGSAG